MQELCKIGNVKKNFDGVLLSWCVCVCVCVCVQLMEAYKTLESECQKSQVAAVETEKKLSRKLREMSEVQELNQLVSLSH